MPTGARTKRTMSPEIKAAYTELERGVRSLARSIAEIRRGLGKAERQIEADARARIRELRAQAKTHVAALQSREREASRTLDRLKQATGDSWRVVKQSADEMLADARSTAAAVIERFRDALGG